MKKKWQISRRRMLKGLGACIALPLLDAMALPGIGSGTAKSPVRTAFLFMPNGVHPERWTPADIGSQFTLTPQLAPLENFKKDILVLGELVWGIAGMVLAIPLLGIVKIICDHVQPLKPYGYLIGGDRKKRSFLFRKKK